MSAVKSDRSVLRGSELLSTIELELSPDGREQLSQLDARNSAGLGLVAEGVLIGFAEPASISANRISFTFASQSEVTAAALTAAIRGPEIPSDLELLE